VDNIYTSGQYLDANQTWHVADSPWKAEQIAEILKANRVVPATVAEIGCGAGAILAELARKPELQAVQFAGYDISPQAIALCSQQKDENIRFVCGDMLAPGSDEHFDVLLIIDVVEHVPDYMGFTAQCRRKAHLKVYHIPLEIHISSVLRNTLLRGRQSVGHLHYFTADSALALLRDTGHEIIDYRYTSGALALYRLHPSPMRALAYGPRWIMSKINLPFTARALGGFSLLVLAR
jgi:SAM-dependent methyltransferase